MRKFIALTVVMIVCRMYSTTIWSQDVDQQDPLTKKEVREEKRARAKAEEDSINKILYNNALISLKDQQFVLEATQVRFRDGYTAYVNSNTNFVLMKGEHSTVQVAFNTPYSGPNGIGGVTVDGRMSGLKMTKDKRGNVNYNFNVQGIGISAQIFITLSEGGNNATVDISPNFNSNNMTLTGKIVPLSESSVFKGRAL